MTETRHLLPCAKQRCCGQCRYFQNSPEVLEQAFPGLTAMSSGFASVRGQDGLCSRHDRYLAYRDTCPDFTTADR